METCKECGAEYFPGNTGWTSCGDCLSARLEWLLMGGVLPTDRRPAKRAKAVDDGPELTILGVPRAA
jgi:hypothetical protein